MRAALCCIALIAAALPARALDPATYTDKSRLATGRWVKISVPQEGLYRISSATLRRWGFASPADVRVFGYGGARIPDLLSAATYVDDLPVVTSVTSDEGITFYATGSRTLEESGGYYHWSVSPYSSVGYYFLSEQPDVAVPETEVVGSASPGAAGESYGLAQYENDLTPATNVGPLMVGESLLGTSRRLTLQTPGRIEGSLNVDCQIVSRLTTSGSVSVTVGDLEPVKLTLGIASGTYTYGTLANLRREMSPAAGETLSVSIDPSIPSSARMANLDYVAVLYPKAPALAPAAANEEFFSFGTASLAGVSASTIIWDVTDPASPKAVNLEGAGSGSVSVTLPGRGLHRLVAWNPDSRIPEPTLAGTVSNQDLHAPLSTPEMVIFATKAVMSQANSIARLHTDNDNMKVDVVDVDLVYNEFSSGAPDISGLRKYLKMLYDRGNAAGKPLRYALLLGRATLDHRGLVKNQASQYTLMPQWVVRADRLSLIETDAFGTDDFIAMLDDGSGANMGLDDLSIAVGRMPMTSAQEGDDMIEKLQQYISSSKKTGWKNKMMYIADDGDNGVHATQTETNIANAMDTPDQQHLYNKIYMDSYTLINGEYPQARADMFRALDEGVAWWYFVGHATNHSWTGENQLNYTDINNLYLRNLPFLVASTCNFLQWDNVELSGGEILYKERQGGVIGMVSATRPAYITDNGYLLAALGRHNLQRDDDGRLLTPGEVYRRAKNDIRDNRGVHVSNTNRLRFAFMGDPALRLSTPDNIVRVDAINGAAPDPDAEAQILIPAMSVARVSGTVTAPDGTPLDDFDGIVSVELYDAQQSRTTNGSGGDRPVTFDVDGTKLYAGSAKVNGGRFDLKISMPSVVADNFRPAAMSFYAYATNSNAEAIGVNRDFYVYGFEEPAVPDTEAPVIESLVLNHSGFRSGDRVNPSPMVIAKVTDNISVNLSNAGVGQNMMLMLDSINAINDLSLYYTPDPDGNPGGVINYPLEGLAEGPHTLRLRIFDTSGNPAVKEIEFTVAEGLTPQIFDVYTDANPASTAANFYIRHDRPEIVTTVSITVYDLMGRPVWEGSRKGMSDMDVSSPVTWDLTDNAGRRVTRGIYLYRASLTADGTSYQTASRRIAVTAE